MILLNVNAPSCPTNRIDLALKYQYALFILITHGVIGVLSYHLLRDTDYKFWLFAVEFCLLLSLLLAYSLYKRFIKPVELMSSGADALEDKDFQVKFLQTGSREMDKLIGVYNQMIDNLREERTQTQEKHFFMQKVLEGSPSAIVLLDYDQKVSYFNPKFERWFAPKDCKGKSLSEANSSILKAAARLKLNKPEIITIGGAQQYRVEVSEFVNEGFKRMFVVIEDLSEELLKAEKRAYEKVIRMMAHEVNNSIGAVNSIIQSTIDFEQEKSDEDSELIAGSLIVAKDRNDSLNKFMRNFADVIRLPEPKKELFELNPIARAAGDLMRLQAGQRDIEIELQLSEKPMKIYLDKKQIEQVLVNVIKNACEAIEQGGKIYLITNAEDKSLIVRDTGHGIKPEQAEKLFSPFYSNKPDGQGIGLTLTRDILHNHGFEFSLSSADGFTDFRIVF